MEWNFFIEMCLNASAFQVSGFDEGAMAAIGPGYWVLKGASCPFITVVKGVHPFLAVNRGGCVVQVSYRRLNG